MVRADTNCTVCKGNSPAYVLQGQTPSAQCVIHLLYLPRDWAPEPVPECGGHMVRLYSMPLLAEMPDQGSRLRSRLWACRYILWGMEHGLRLARAEPIC